MTRVQIAILAAGIPSQCLLLIAWLLRGRRQPFWPVGLYVSYHLVFSIAMRLLHLRRRDVGQLSYVDQGVDFALLTAVIVGILPYDSAASPAWPSRMKKYVVAALAAGISFAGLLVASLRFVGFTQSEMWNDRLDLLSSLVLCTLLVIAGWVTPRLKGGKSTNATAIGRGLAMWACVALIVDICHMNAAWSQSAGFDETANAFWVFMILWWAYVIWTVKPCRPVRPRDVLSVETESEARS